MDCVNGLLDVIFFNVNVSIIFSCAKRYEICENSRSLSFF